MPDKTENHTLRLLQKIHAKLEEHDSHFEQAQQERHEMREQLDSIQSVVAGSAYFQADARTQLEALELRMARVEKELGLADSPAE